MNLLLTSVRMPFAIDEVRKLGRRGHHVLASDTYRSAPGGHSRYVAEHLLTPTPRYETQDFIRCIHHIVGTRQIDLVVPIFEEALYLAKHQREWDGNGNRLFAPSFDVMLQLHDKSSFAELAASLEIPCPRTEVVRSREELQQATSRLTDYVARPALSRGGFEVATNRGALRDLLPSEQVAPSQRRPWIVQPYLDGREVCTFSVAQHGRVVAHLTYIHPRTLQYAGGISFETIERPDTLEYTERLVQATGYHGQLGLDFLETPDGLRVLECNVRATAGVAMLSDEVFDQALRDRVSEPPYVAPAGVRAKISLGLVRDMFLNLRELPQDLEALFSRARDLYVSREDPLPVLYALLAYRQVRRWRAYTGADRKTRRRMLHAVFFDISWNGGAT